MSKLLQTMFTRYWIIKLYFAKQVGLKKVRKKRVFPVTLNGLSKRGYNIFGADYTGYTVYVKGEKIR